ncbi:MAG TPA: TlyA family RNA methyltransferase [bacterium]|nr:TlyA family RNA methyltransferase [bacterium]
MRLDQLLVERGLAKNREEAKRFILAGEILVEDRRDVKPGQMFADTVAIECRGKTCRYVSRGGEKLERALAVFNVNPSGLVCGDFGASTGGFTDCLLQHGACRVYAFDVGQGQLAWSLRQDARVILTENCNLRFLQKEHVPEPLQIIAIDVSFISLSLILPSASGVLAPEGAVICLVKPQFEIGKGRVGKGGVVRDPEDWKEVLNAHCQHAANSGFHIHGLTVSPIQGSGGNVEFLSLLRETPCPDMNPSQAIQACIEAGSILKTAQS